VTRPVSRFCWTGGKLLPHEIGFSGILSFLRIRVLEYSSPSPIVLGKE